MAERGLNKRRSEVLLDALRQSHIEHEPDQTDKSLEWKEAVVLELALIDQKQDALEERVE